KLFSVLLVFVLLTYGCKGRVKSKNFIIEYDAIGKYNNYKECLAYLEKNYPSITNFFEINKMDKVKIIVYDSKEKFIKKSKAPDWAIAACIDKRTVLTYLPFYNPQTEKTYLNYDMLLHEFVHSAIRYKFPTNRIPVWIDESIAQYLSKTYLNPISLGYVKEGDYPTFFEIESYSGQKVYQVGYVLAEFILNKLGKDKMFKIIENDGNISKAINLTTLQLEEEWHKYLKEYISNSLKAMKEGN
ncbi:MAG: hypothetical protein ACP5Q5_11070, partial [Brevinematia bacterium]